MNYTTSQVKNELNDPKFLQHCIALLLGQQLQLEHEWSMSVVVNGKGLSAADASYFEFLARVPMYPELMPKAIAKTSRYAKQLCSLLNEESTIDIPAKHSEMAFA